MKIEQEYKNGKITFEECEKKKVELQKWNNGLGGQRCVNFLVWEVNGKYYETFSDKQIEKKSETHHDGYNL